MKNRKLLLIASLVLALTMSLGGTLAYLTDTDSDVNVMTLGNVDIEQIELQRKDGVAHNAAAKDGDLVPFVEGQPLYPAYASADSAYTAEATDLFVWGPYVTADSDAEAGTAAANSLWDDNELHGAIDKFVFVKNTGSSDAYYRTWIAFECPEGMEYSAGSDKEFMMNINLNKRFAWSESEYVTIAGTRYLVKCVTYTQALPAGEISRPSLLQVVMTDNATSEDMKLLGDTYEILAFTQAVQTTNFDHIETVKDDEGYVTSCAAMTALDAAFGKIKEDDGTINHPWKDEEGNDNVEGLPVTVVDTAAELTEALAKGGKVMLTGNISVDATIEIPAGVSVTLDLNGKTLTGDVAKTAGAVIENNGTLSIYGGKLTNTEVNGGSVINNEGTLTLENVTIVGAPIGETDYPSYAVYSSGALTVEEGTTITSDRGPLYLSGTTSTTTVNGGTFTTNDTAQNLTCHVVYVYGGANLIINDGTFQNLDQETSGGTVICNSTANTIYVNGGNFSGGNYYGINNLVDYGYGGTYSVTGGTYTAKPSAKYVAAGYAATQNEDGSWTVAAN